MSDVEEMQAELRVESEEPLDERAKPNFLKRKLSEQGLGGGYLTLSRQVALTMTSICVPPIPRVSRAARACYPAYPAPSRQVTSAAPGVEAPLAPNPETVVTEENKRLYLERTLEHKLVLTIAQQADSFRQVRQR